MNAYLRLCLPGPAGLLVSALRVLAPTDDAPDLRPAWSISMKGGIILPMLFALITGWHLSLLTTESCNAIITPSCLCAVHS